MLPLNKKNLVIVGFGGMGGWHASFAKNSDAVNLLGIWDIKADRRAAAEAQGIHAYSSFEEVLNDPRVDLLTLAVPNDMHRPLAEQALAAGKNVISEKPVTLSHEDLQAMIDAAHQSGKLFTTHQNRRWDGEYLMMKQVYASGDLGDVFRIESRVHGSNGIPGDWRREKAHGGGMMLDWGVHLIDQMMGIVTDRKIEKIFCLCDHVTTAEVDDGFKLTLFYEGGLTALIEVGTSNFINLPRFYMCGANGTAMISDWNQPTRVVCCKVRKDENLIPIRTAAGLTKTMAPRSPESITSYEIPQPASDVHNFYRNVVRAIDGLEPQIVTHDQLMRVMRIMEAAMESDRLGMPVKFEDR